MSTRSDTRMGVPTFYRHIHFRSRLEATWACWFDKVGWPWRYEPIDLEGYIPDFILSPPGGHILVEVKPALSLAELEADYTGRLERTGWQRHGRDMLLVGVGLFTLDGGWDVPSVGLLGEWIELAPESWSWGGAPLGRCSLCGRITFCHQSQSYTCRICGGHPGGAWPTGLASELTRWWAEAQNATQWNPTTPGV